METLTQKELAPYLPFELKVIWSDGKIDTINPLLSERNNVENEVSLQLALFAFEKEHLDLKPIFYPLDYLTKPITHNGETIVPCDELEYVVSESIVSYVKHRLDILEHWRVQKLFEWRFDVFNLINRGLAVPITEEFNPYK